MHKLRESGDRREPFRARLLLSYISLARTRTDYYSCKVERLGSFGARMRSSACNQLQQVAGLLVGWLAGWLTGKANGPMGSRESACLSMSLSRGGCRLRRVATFAVKVKRRRTTTTTTSLPHRSRRCGPPIDRLLVTAAAAAALQSFESAGLAAAAVAVAQEARHLLPSCSPSDRKMSSMPSHLQRRRRSRSRLGARVALRLALVACAPAPKVYASKSQLAASE